MNTVNNLLSRYLQLFMKDHQVTFLIHEHSPKRPQISMKLTDILMPELSQACLRSCLSASRRPRYPQNDK